MLIKLTRRKNFDLLFIQNVKEWLNNIWFCQIHVNVLERFGFQPVPHLQHVLKCNVDVCKCLSVNPEKKPFLCKCRSIFTAIKKLPQYQMPGIYFQACAIHVVFAASILFFFHLYISYNWQKYWSKLLPSHKPAWCYVFSTLTLW